MKMFGKVLCKAGGAALTLAGIAGLAITVVYWLDLDDKAVDGMVKAMHKAGKLKEMQRMKEEYEAAQATGAES